MSAATACDAAWAVLAAAVVVAVVASHRRRARLARPAQLLRRARSSPLLSLALMAGWAWLGWHFFAR